MAHHIYHTDGFVLGRFSAGEWDSRVVLFTRELGLVTALVKGYRRPLSKLRAHLSLLAEVQVGLVRGKETWRLVFVQSTGLVEQVSKARSKRLVVSKILAVVRRLVKGEYPSPEVFEEVRRAIEDLAPLPPEAPELLDQVELIRVLRILDHLGYIPASPDLRVFTGSSSFVLQPQGLPPVTRQVLIDTINTSLQATHL